MSDEPTVSGTYDFIERFDTEHNAVADIEAALSEKLGCKVRFDKIANRIYVCKMVEVATTIAEITEQELLALPGSAVDVLAELATRVVPYPEMVSLDRSCMLFEKCDNVRVPYFPTSEGPAYLFTLSSRRGMDMRVAHNELAQMLTNGILRESERGDRPDTYVDDEGHVQRTESVFTEEDGTVVRAISSEAIRSLRAYADRAQTFDGARTLVVLNKVKEYADTFHGFCQVWCDAAVLSGRWVWDADTKQMIRSDA